ncbi:MAG TPA: disulfide bond formation protein B [Burkholderiales bacterium]|jgi:disulfide bond formation protein DsbB|nr:disulfide bond formation protein B [Burkholderiales bacterium]
MRTLPPRRIFAAMFAACAGLIGFALFLQHGRGLEPCPMCILQRYAFIGIGIVALVAALHGPGALARRIYAGLLIVLAAAGGGVAIRHVYLEHNPPELFDCGADLGYLLQSFTMSDMLPMIFRGTGDCSKVPWRFLGLSIAEWSLVWFAILLAAAIAVLAARPRPATARS